MIIKVMVPVSENTVEVDTDRLPDNVTARLVEMAVTTYIRSVVSSAFNNEKAKAERDHDAAEAAAKKADKSHKVTAFDAKAFVSEIDADEYAIGKVEDLYEGTIRAARGKSGENKALISLVTSNVISALKAKGKKHKDAVAMIAGDPFGFIEKSARKRAGDDAEAYKTEIAKLNALYVDPARAILGGGNSSSDDGDDADDLI